MCTISRDMVKIAYRDIRNGGHLRFQDGPHQKKIANVTFGQPNINNSQKYDKY